MILKCESKIEDMMEELHSFMLTTSTEHDVEVPGSQRTFTTTGDSFHYTLLGMSSLPPSLSPNNNYEISSVKCEEVIL